MLRPQPPVQIDGHPLYQPSSLSQGLETKIHIERHPHILLEQGMNELNEIITPKNWPIAASSRKCTVHLEGQAQIEGQPLPGKAPSSEGQLPFYLGGLPHLSIKGVEHLVPGLVLGGAAAAGLAPLAVHQALASERPLVDLPEPQMQGGRKHLIGPLNFWWDKASRWLLFAIGQKNCDQNCCR